MGTPSTESRYSILITLYDPSLETSPLASPLLPPTRTRLPPSLDERLDSTLDQLVLPPTRRDFWSLNLHPTRPFDISLASTLSAQHPSARPASVTTRPLEKPNRIWSQHFNLAPASPPLAIQTNQLWTPSRALPLTKTSSPPAPAPSSGPQPILDFRFGPIEIDWIKFVPTPMTPRPSTAPVGDVAEDSTSPTDSSSGTSSLYWGTIHLYREAGVPAEHESTRREKQLARDRDDGTSLALVSVPGVLNAAAILKFVSSRDTGGLDLNRDVEHVRMLRDSTPARSIVVIKFRDAERAIEFRRRFNGKKYYDSKDSELCHVVPISSIMFKSTSVPPYTLPHTPSPSLQPPRQRNPESTTINSKSTATKTSPSLSPSPPSTTTEIPTCPICLERLDSKVTGLVQIVCKHNYHCNCLLRWGDSRCPVCRATNLKPSKSSNEERAARRTRAGEGGQDDHEEEEEGEDSLRTSNCSVCTSPSNLWICVICGNVGCGRYQGGHAHSHFTETGHSFSLELQTGRIWSYTDDEYVHRLLRLPSTSFNHSSTNGAATSTARLIELPSLPALNHHQSGQNGNSTPDDISSKIASSYGFGGGPDRSAEEEQDKLERIAIEYSSLLQTNLDQQREWFEDELSRSQGLNARTRDRAEDLERELLAKRAEIDSIRAEAQTYRDEVAKSRHALERIEKELERVEDERKRERLDAQRQRKSIERELEQERSVTTHLSRNLAAMKSEIDERKLETSSVRLEVDELKDQLNDLMAALTMRDRIEQEPEASELRGASIGVVPGGTNADRGEGNQAKTPSQVLGEKRKKKNKKKK